MTIPYHPSNLLRTLILALATMIPTWLSAQNPYHIETVSTNGCAVFCTFKDADGIMWVGTYNGLITYSQLYSRNPFGYSRHEALGTIVSTIDQDNLGRLWLGTQDNRYFCYNPKDGTLTADVTAWLDSIGIHTNGDYRIAIDDLGRLWLHSGAAAYVINPSTGKAARLRLPQSSGTVLRIVAKGSHALIATAGRLLLVDTSTLRLREEKNIPVITSPDHVYLSHGSHGDVWLANLQHLYRYDRREDRWITYRQQMFDIIGFATMKSGTTCVATTNCGLYLFDTEGGETRHVTQQDPWLPGLRSNHLKHIYYDRRTDNLWLTYSKSDMSVVSESNPLFRNYSPTATGATAGADNRRRGTLDIIALAQAPDGSLWVGTEDDGISQISPGDHATVLRSEYAGSTVTSLLFDSKGRRWTGFYRQGLACSDGRRFFDGKSPYTIAEAPDGRIYVVLPGDGLWCVDPTSGATSHIPTDSQWLMELSISDGKIYVASPMHLYQIDTRDWSQKKIPAGRFRDSNLSVGIKTIMADSRGWVWLVNYKNFSNVDIYDTRHDRTISVSGLNYYYINSIAEDKEGNVWLTTNQGLVRVRVTDGKVPSFDTYCFSDPQATPQTYYNERAALCLDDGCIVVGTTSGYSILNPRKTEAKASRQSGRCPLICSSLQVNDNYISPLREYDGRVLVQSDLTYMQSLDLGSRQNNLSLEFCPRDFASDVARVWQYKLEGLGDNWHPMRDYQITLSNLPSGTYTLVLRENGLNQGEQYDYRVLTIRIRPPFWLTWQAFVLYAVALMLLMGLLYNYFSNKRRYRRQVMEMEREAEREAAVNEMKMRFFTNVSHDLRTPLTLIITPVEEMMNTVRDVSMRETLGIVYTNARKLYQLVNQILDFRKIESAKPVLEPSFDDIVTFVTGRAKAFSLMARQNNISLNVEQSVDRCDTVFDKDKAGKVIDNLLSNAFKFTPKGGSITVAVARQHDNAVITVADTGVGIADVDRNHIFDRFYVSKRNSNKGIDSTGIGLHVVKEYVELHGGTVSVGDNSPKGTIFTITLPVVSTAEENAQRSTVTAPRSASDAPRSTPSSSTLLIVEDNPDLLSYMSRMLGADYTICQATDGRQALDVLQGTDVDLIVSDVMMEGMDGLELCRTLKSDISTSHIPVILLTARALASDELEGLQTGADDYIVKPFHLDILRQRIINLLERTRRAQERFSSEPQIEPSEVTVTTLDEEFLANAIRVVEEHIDDPSFSVDDLSARMFMHRTNFYRKIQFITGKTPAQFVRLLRLKRARQLLSRGNVLVSQVAFQVGFNSPKKFARYFKEEFGQYPSEYAKSQEGN